MKPFFCSISAFALIVLLILPSFKLSAQSTLPYAEDSLDVIAEYVRNSRALLDSLTRLSDTRTQLSISKKSLKALQTENTRLFAEKIKAQTAANEMAERLWNCNESHAAQSKKLRKANIEKWVWRGLATIGVVALARSIVPP